MADDGITLQEENKAKVVLDLRRKKTKFKDKGTLGRWEEQEAYFYSKGYFTLRLDKDNRH